MGDPSAYIADYAIFVLDHDGILKTWNPGVAKLFQYSQEEFIGKPGSLIFTPEDVAARAPEQEMAIARRHGRAEDQRWHQRKDGSKFWANGMLMAAESVGFVKVVRDDTERKLEQDRFELVLKATSDAIWDWDRQTDQVWWNEGLRRLFGYEPGTYPMQWWIERIHPADRERVSQKLQKHSKWSDEYRFRRSDGKYAHVLDRGFGVERNGTVVRMVGALADLTERDEAYRIKDEFLATLSHELRTPLASILGWAKILGTQSLDAETQQQAIETIERNAKAQSKLIEDILDVSRVMTGKLNIQARQINLKSAVEPAVDSIRPAAAAKDIELEVDFKADPVIHGDPDRLQQIIWNLLSNAIKFTPRQGKVSVKLERKKDSACIQVCDNGLGIDPEFLPYIFERFRQGDQSTTRRQSGLGLGLAIVRQLVEGHGGTVIAESEGPGEGSKFTVSFPVSKSGERPGEPPRPEPVESKLTNVRILVVDDQLDARLLLKTVLKREGANVELAASAEEALQVLRKTSLDLVISDIGMPEMDGYELMEEVRKRYPDLPAIALTAYAQAEDRHRALEAGYNLYLAKPIDPNELVRAVQGELS